MAVCAGQSFVTGDHDITHLPRLGLHVGALVEEIVSQLRRVVENVGNGFEYFCKVGDGIVQPPLGFAQIGRGDQIHGVGDLQGLLHAFDPGADLFDSSQRASPSFLP